jgi:hypothetical protein
MITRLMQFRSLLYKFINDYSRRFNDKVQQDIFKNTIVDSIL